MMHKFISPFTMARTFLSKANLFRSNRLFNHTTRALSYSLLSNTSKLQPTHFLPHHSAAASADFRLPHRTYCTGASSQPNESSSIGSPLMQSMEKKIKEHLKTESVTVTDASGDGRHVTIYAISEAFEGQNTVSRQRMVYKAIWEELQDTVHAVHQMVTLTPTEAKTKNQ